MQKTKSAKEGRFGPDPLKERIRPVLDIGEKIGVLGAMEENSVFHNQ